FAFVFTRTLRTPPGNVPPGPVAGAVKVTRTPATGVLLASLTVTASGTGNGEPTVVDSPSAAPALMLGGGPARFSRSYRALLALPAMAAVAVKRPALVLARSSGERARPLASVVAVACVPPSGKCAAAPVVPVPRLKVTLTPSSGAPSAASTRAVS